MNPYADFDQRASPTLRPPPLIQTGHSSTGSFHTLNAPNPHVQLPTSDLSLPAYSQSVPESSSLPHSTQNPYAPQPALISQSPHLHQSSNLRLSVSSQCSEESCRDLECAICFSQFNNIFRCPKMLQCNHTFCLECLARINVKSSEPSTIQCPLCRGLTPLPELGLPKLNTDLNVLSCLPAAMQRVYSIRFVRNKGKLQIKRATDDGQRQDRRSVTSLRSINRTLDVGTPSPTTEPVRRRSGFGGTLFQLTGRPLCRAFLLTTVLMMMLALMGITIYLMKKDSQ